MEVVGSIPIPPTKFLQSSAKHYLKSRVSLRLSRLFAFRLRRCDDAASRPLSDRTARIEGLEGWTVVWLRLDYLSAVINALVLGAWGGMFWWRMTAWVRGAWRNGGAAACIALAYLLAAYQILRAVDAYEHVRGFLAEYEHYELDELFLLAAMAFPFFCVALWVQSRRLRREVLRRQVLDGYLSQLPGRER